MTTTPATRWDLLAVRAKRRWHDAQRDLVQAKETLQAAKAKQQQMQHMVNSYHERAVIRQQTGRLVGDVSLGMHFLGQLSTVLKGAEQEVAIGERRVERAQKLAAEAKLAWDKVEQLEQRQSARLHRAAREKEQKGFDQLALVRYHQRQS